MMKCDFSFSFLGPHGGDQEMRIETEIKLDFKGKPGRTQFRARPRAAPLPPPLAGHE